MQFGGLVGDDTGDDRDRPPLVLLHGLTFDRRTWGPVIDAFRKIDANRRVVALDLPAHGESAPHPPHDLLSLTDVVHDALAAAGIDRPVMVGHSLSGALVSNYGATFPVAGVVNVDQPIMIEPFAEMLRSIEPQLRGDGFAQVWPMFFQSFHTERLPPAARDLVESTCNPRQDVVVSYWSMLLERPVDEVAKLIDESARRGAASGVPYVWVAGETPPDGLVAWTRERVPQLQLEVWEPAGHFPQLAFPDRFASLLNSTADW